MYNRFEMCNRPTYGGMLRLYVYIVVSCYIVYTRVIVCVCSSLLVYRVRTCTCVNVFAACIYIVLLIVNDRRIRFYNIMQLVCVIKYILEFDTLVKTIRRAIPCRTFVLLPSVVH